MSTTKRVLGGALATLVGVASALFISTAPAYADNGPHVKVSTADNVLVSELQPGRCASCHRVHTAKSTDGMLLKTDQTNLCYSCHGDGGTGAMTNVQSGIGYAGAGEVDPTTGIWTDSVRGAQVGALRGGGFDQAMIDAGAAVRAGTTSPTGATAHLIPAATTPEVTNGNHMGGQGIVWGAGAYSETPVAGTALAAGVQLECGSCHDPHGNGNYRILKAIPDFTPGTTAQKEARQVNIPDTDTKVYTTTNYWFAADTNAFLGKTSADGSAYQTNMALQGVSATDPTPISKPLLTRGTNPQPVYVDKHIANVAAWCTTCHTRYLAPSGSRSNDSGDAIYTYRHTSDHLSGGEYGANRNCMSCHVAHGSNATMGETVPVEWPGGTATSSDNRMLRVDDRGVCLLCHKV